MAVTSPAPLDGPRADAGAPLRGGVSLHTLPRVVDERGELVFGEEGTQLPFRPRRFYTLYAMPEHVLRGDHAHRACERLMVCLHGAVTITADDGQSKREVRLDTPSLALHAPPMTWCEVRPVAPGAVLLVLASELYDAADYVRDYDEFRRLTAGRRPPAPGLPAIPAP
jgi:UDP-2-acetamido-3-amino-2,3-dideoxy-glucuronate N-acetyltransferase